MSVCAREIERRIDTVDLREKNEEKTTTLTTSDQADLRYDAIRYDIRMMYIYVNADRYTKHTANVLVLLLLLLLLYFVFIALSRARSLSLSLSFSSNLSLVAQRHNFKFYSLSLTHSPISFFLSFVG